MKTKELLTEAVKVKGKAKEYVRISYVSLRDALNKTFDQSLARYDFGDDLHVFEGIKGGSRYRGTAAHNILEHMSYSRGLSSSDIDLMLSIAVSNGLLTGQNFIVDMDER